MPANVLILLDKSGSMGWRMSGGSSGISLPYDTTTDANGNLYVAQYSSYGIKKLEYANAKVDASWGVNGTPIKEIVRLIIHIVLNLQVEFFMQLVGQTEE